MTNFGHFANVYPTPLEYNDLPTPILSYLYFLFYRHLFTFHLFIQFTFFYKLLSGLKSVFPPLALIIKSTIILRILSLDIVELI